MDDALIRQNSTQPPLLRPVRTAALIAGGYLVLASIYILLSSTMASERSGTIEELRRIEIAKGLAFVFGSAALLFALNATALLRVRRNELLARRMERALTNAERSVLAGTFARTIAHDINNGLTAARMNLEMLRDSLPPGDDRLQLADDAATALSSIAEWNQRFFEIGGRSLLEEARPIDLSVTVRAAARLAEQHKALREATIEVHVPDVAPYVGIESIIQRAVLNLVLNAVDAAGPRARVSLSIAALGTQGWMLSVEDDGPGVPAAVRARMFEPFFTTKPTGTGLGLASVVACARFHGGQVYVADSKWNGARFDLELRVVARADDVRPEWAPNTPPVGSRPVGAGRRAT
jgi:signal transduction histidine kinase